MATDEQADVQGGSVRVVGVEPIFAVADVPPSVGHYELLGFGTSTTMSATRLRTVTI